MSVRVFAVLLLLAIVGIIAATVISAPDVPNPDPPELTYAYEHESELMKKAEQGDNEAAKKLIFAYEWDGDVDKKNEVMKMIDKNKKSDHSNH